MPIGRVCRVGGFESRQSRRFPPREFQQEDMKQMRNMKRTRNRRRPELAPLLVVHLLHVFSLESKEGDFASRGVRCCGMLG